MQALNLFRASLNIVSSLLSEQKLCLVRNLSCLILQTNISALHFQNKHLNDLIFANNKLVFTQSLVPSPSLEVLFLYGHVLRNALGERSSDDTVKVLARTPRRVGHLDNEVLFGECVARREVFGSHDGLTKL